MSQDNSIRSRSAGSHHSNPLEENISPLERTFQGLSIEPKHDGTSAKDPASVFESDEILDDYVHDYEDLQEAVLARREAWLKASKTFGTEHVHTVSLRNEYSQRRAELREFHKAMPEASRMRIRRKVSLSSTNERSTPLPKATVEQVAPVEQAIPEIRKPETGIQSELFHPVPSNNYTEASMPPVPPMPDVPFEYHYQSYQTESHQPRSLSRPVTPFSERFRADVRRFYSDHPSSAGNERMDDWSDTSWSKVDPYRVPRFDLDIIPRDAYEYRQLEKRLTKDLKDSRAYAVRNSNGKVSLKPLIQHGTFRKETAIDLHPRLVMVFLAANRQFGYDSPYVTDATHIMETLQSEMQLFQYHHIDGMVVCPSPGHWLMRFEIAQLDGRWYHVQDFISMVQAILDYEKFVQQGQEADKQKRELFQDQIKHGIVPILPSDAPAEQVKYYTQLASQYRDRQREEREDRRDSLLADAIQSLRLLVNTQTRESPNPTVVTNVSRPAKEEIKKFPKYPGRQLGEKGTLGQGVFGWLEEFDATCDERNIKGDRDRIAWFRECIDNTNPTLSSAATALRQCKTWQEAKQYLIRTLVTEDERKPYNMWARVEKLTYDPQTMTVEAFATRFLTTVDDFRLACQVSHQAAKFEPTLSDQLSAWFSSFKEGSILMMKYDYLDKGTPLEDVVRLTKLKIEDIYVSLKKGSGTPSSGRREPRSESRPDYKYPDKGAIKQGGTQERPRVAPTSSRERNDYPRRDNQNPQAARPSGQQLNRGAPPVPPKPVDRASAKKFEPGSKMSNVKCFRCGEIGHIAPECQASEDHILPEWRGGYLMANAEDETPAEYESDQESCGDYSQDFH